MRAGYAWAALAAAWILVPTTSAAQELGRQEAAIVDGTVADGFPSVVALTPRRTRCAERGAEPFCTGTLIGPRTVLTAAHCVETFREPGSVEVFFGADPTTGLGRFVVVQSALQHPDYDREHDLFDAAILTLAEPVFVARPVEIASIDEVELASGDPVLAVGFGVTRSEDPTGPKRAGTMRVSEVETLAFRTDPDPSMSCTGDSGGPVFVERDGAHVLVGITVSGDFACREEAFNGRVDAVWSPFVTTALQQAERTSLGWTSADLPLASLCDASCADASACPAAMSCRLGFEGGQCALPASLPGRFEQPCASDDECDGSCARVWPGGGGCYCLDPCQSIAQPDAGQDDTEVDSADVDVTLRGSGGCQHAPSRQSPGLCLLALGVALGLSQRRSAREDDVRAQ